MQGFSLLCRLEWDQSKCLLYSRASNNGPSKKRTASLQRTSAVLPIEFSIVIIESVDSISRDGTDTPYM